MKSIFVCDDTLPEMYRIIQSGEDELKLEVIELSSSILSVMMSKRIKIILR